jgi:hypothetical protein
MWTPSVLVCLSSCLSLTPSVLVCLSSCLSLTYCQRLNRLSNFFEIRHGNSLQKILSKCDFGESWLNDTVLY